MGRFVILRRKDGQLFFQFKGSNGQNILSSEGYSSFTGIESGIASVKKNAKLDSSYIRNDKAGNNGFSYNFRIVAGNGQIIGMSERFISREARERAIDELKHTAESAIVQKELIWFN
ncbi:hypothetical protein GCM10027592_29630 [Spirosoma flavus]